MKKRDSILGTISLIIFVLLMLVYLVSSIINLARFGGLFGIREPEGFINTGEFVSVNADYVKGPIYTISHSMNGVIPMGTEYYYEVMDSQTGTVYIVRASKFFEKYERSDAVITIRGKVRKADSAMSSGMKEINDSYIEAGYQTGFVGDPVYIDNYVKTVSILSIVAFILFVGGVFLLAFSAAARKPANTFSVIEKVFVSSFVIIALVGLIMIFYTVTFLF